jgi:hypothetical protein
MPRALWRSMFASSSCRVVAYLITCRGRGHRVRPPRAPLPREEVMFGFNPRGLARVYHDIIIFLFAKVGLLEVASYCDDPTRTGHLEL